MPAQPATWRHEAIVDVKPQSQCPEWLGQCEYSVYLLGNKLLQIDIINMEDELAVQIMLQATPPLNKIRLYLKIHISLDQ